MKIISAGFNSNYEDRKSMTIHMVNIEIYRRYTGKFRTTKKFLRKPQVEFEYVLYIKRFNQACNEYDNLKEGPYWGKVEDILI